MFKSNWMIKKQNLRVIWHVTQNVVAIMHTTIWEHRNMYDLSLRHWTTPINKHVLAIEEEKQLTNSTEEKNVFSYQRD